MTTSLTIQQMNGFDSTTGATPGKLRVLQVALRYFPFMGGVETHTYEVARRLARQGVDVTVLTTDTTGKLPASSRSRASQSGACGRTRRIKIIFLRLA